MLSEEAFILVVISGAFVLLVLGVLELMWPTRPRQPARRAQARATTWQSTSTEPDAIPRPESILRPRPYEAVTPVEPGTVTFPPPPRYLAPARTPEPVAPPPLEPESPARLTEEDVSAQPVEEKAPPPPLETALPAPIHDDKAPPEPDDDGVPLELEVATPPRAPEVPAPEPVDTITSPPTLEPPPLPPEESPAPPRPRRRSKISPHARPHGVLRGPRPPDDFSVDRATTEPAPLGGAGTDQSGPPSPEARPRRDSPLVETCFALYQEKRFSEVVSIGERTLAKAESPAAPSHETAALWSVVGLAKQGLGDDDGARAALESALDVAPDGERATYRRHLATLALEAAQSRLARAGGHDTGDRVATTRTAIVWTERGLAAVPFDPALSDARERAYEALWEGYEEAFTVLLQRQEFRGARQLLREALDDPALPAARAAGFRGLFSGTFSGEIGQLTAQAILGMQEGRETEALESLQRAEDLLTTIPPEALPASRREEVDQRLWWGYAELGSRRLEAGDYEEALDPLTHALRFESIGPERQAETRAAVVRALEGIAAVRAMSVRRLIDAGLRDEAVQTAEQLRALVNGCRDLGLTENELLAASSRVQRLWEELGLEDRA